MFSSILLLQDSLSHIAPLKVVSEVSVSININSLTRHLDEIRIFIEDKQPHILHLNDTKIDESISDDDTGIEGYIVNRKDRNRFGGGVAIYIHATMQFTLCEDLKDLDLEDIVSTHDTFMKPLGIELSDDAKRLPYLYWTPSCIILQ